MRLKGHNEIILFINDHLGQGGVGSVNRKLIKELASRGHLVYSATLFQEHRVEGASNVYLAISRLQAILVLPLLYKLVRLLRTIECDYVISSKDYINIWVICAFWLARAGKCKLLINSHVVVSSRLAHEAKWIHRMSIRLARFLYAKASIVANVSELASRDAEEFFGLPKVHTLHNPIVSRRDIERSFATPYHPFFASQNQVIVSCGRLESEKNHELMIRAFKIACERRSDLSLIILGEGSLRGDLEGLIKSLGLEQKVSLPGYDPEPQAYMEHCDLFWLTSKFEGFGVVLVEALCVGAPILSVDCPHGPREILCGGRYGGLVKSFDPLINAEALLDALEKPRLTPDRLKRRALDFEIVACSNRYLLVLRSH